MPITWRLTEEVFGCSLVRSTSSPFWSHLWKLKIPRSIILFLWRVSNEALPTKSNLCKRKVVFDQLCTMCGIEAETSGHVLWSCNASQAVWGICEGPIQKSSIVADVFFNVVGYRCDRLNDGEMELFAIIAHKIWLLRNRLVFGGLVQSPSCLVKAAIEDLDEFRKTLVDVVVPSNGG